MIASDGLDIVLGKDSVYLFDVIGLEHDVSVVAVNRETVHILDIYSTVVDGAEKLLKTTYLVGDLNNGNVGEKRRKAVFAELFLALFGAVNDKTEQTELGGVGKAQRENVDVVVLEHAENLAKSTCSVFDKYC